MSYIDELHTKWPLWSDGDWCHEACAEVDRLRADLAAVTAERAELRKDKERLDWVQAQTVSGFLWGFRRFPQTGGGGMYQLIQFVKDESLSESVRSAIDAARADAARKEPPAKAHGCEVGE